MANNPATACADVADEESFLGRSFVPLLRAERRKCSATMPKPRRPASIALGLGLFMAVLLLLLLKYGHLGIDGVAEDKPRRWIVASVVGACRYTRPIQLRHAP